MLRLLLQSTGQVYLLLSSNGHPCLPQQNSSICPPPYENRFAQFLHFVSLASRP